MTSAKSTIGDGDGQRAPVVTDFLESTPTGVSVVGKDEPNGMDVARAFRRHLHPQEAIGIGDDMCLSTVGTMSCRGSGDERHIFGASEQLGKGIIGMRDITHPLWDEATLANDHAPIAPKDSTD